MVDRFNGFYCLVSYVSLFNDVEEWHHSYINGADFLMVQSHQCTKLEALPAFQFIQFRMLVLHHTYVYNRSSSYQKNRRQKVS